MPADIMFIGEAPGESEDTSGDVFDGQAGELLHKIIVQSGADKYRIAFGNLLACIPWDAEKADKEEPDHDCIMTCKPRLEELIKMIQPKLIIQVGKHAAEYLDPTWKDGVKYPNGTHTVHIVHPASILRDVFIRRKLSVQKCVVDIRNAIQEHLTNADSR